MQGRSFEPVESTVVTESKASETSAPQPKPVPYYPDLQFQYNWMKQLEVGLLSPFWYQIGTDQRPVTVGRAAFCTLWKT